MNQSGVVRKFFALVFSALFVGLLLLLLASLFGYNDLHAGKLGIACLITAFVAQKLRGEMV